MNQSSSASARAVAVAALVCGFLVVIVVIAASLGDGDGKESGERSQTAKMAAGKDSSGPPPKAYVVQNGDTLTSIARETGVSVTRIQELNPGVDPQILVSGEKLKLR